MKKKVTVLLMMVGLMTGGGFAAIGDVWDLSDALFDSIDPNFVTDPNLSQNPYTDGDGTWLFHPANPVVPYTLESVTPSVTFNPELPILGRGWGINHVSLTSFLSADGSATNYQIGDVGGHGGTGATWTADVGGSFLIEYSAFNARTTKSNPARNLAFTLTVAGVVEDQIDVPDTTYPDSFNRYWGTPIIRELTAGENVTLNLTAGDWLACSLRITEIDASGGQLTINVDPAYVNTVIPYSGETQTQGVLAPIAIDAQPYINCPNGGEVLVFDHWVEGSNVSIASLTSASTTATILAAGTADITAVYVDGRECGDLCHPYPAADLEPDCVVDLLDFAVLAGQWLTDTSVQ